MKTGLMLVGAAVMGAAIGGLWTYFDMSQGVELFMPAEYAARASEQARDVRPPEPGESPKVEVVGSAEFDFGSMDSHATQQHTFRLKNVGQVPLVVEKGPTSCKCTVGELPKGMLDPGETVDILVEWTGKATLGQVDFVQTVQIKTNDPNQPTIEFTIRGYLTESVRVLPGELAVGTISANETVHTVFRLFAFRSEKLEILESGWDNEETAGCFELTWEPMPDEEVKEERGAIVGLLGKVAIKPGLPLGPINQTITLKVRADEDNDVRIPIGGRTLSDIRLASSPRYNANRNVVSLGVVPRDETARAVLQMYVTGPYRHETHFTVAEVDPATQLAVTVSEPKELNQGKALQYTVTIDVAGTAGPVNRLGGDTAPMGRVVLETTHPQTKRVPINVRFAVE